MPVRYVAFMLHYKLAKVARAEGQELIISRRRRNVLYHPPILTPFSFFSVTVSYSVQFLRSFKVIV